MTGWSAGYVHELAYTYGFYRELTPEILQFAALCRGDAAATRSCVNYCELGCGQGFSANILAAANPHIQFHATDFNPAQIAGAKALAEAGGAKNIHFYDQSFQQFIEDSSLPQFEIIALHGIYSWINAENRQAIVDFIDKKLKPGGIVYISYNSLPGWSASAPMRHLLYLHGKSLGGPTGGRLEPSLQFAGQVMESGARYFQQNPAVGQRLAKLQSQNRNYLAHEYFNDAWTLLYHSDVAEELSRARLSFAASAHLSDHIEAINLTADQQVLLAGVADPVFRETVRDYFGNQQFRRDIFVRGAVALNPHEGLEIWLDQRFALSTRRQDVPLKATGWLGEADLQEEVYGPLLDGLVNGPRTVRELMATPSIAALGWMKLQQALTVLVGTGHLQPALGAQGDSARRKSTQAFNAAVINRARYSPDLQALASPVTGGGVGIGRFEQLFLLALSQGKKEPAQWANFVWSILLEQGQRIVQEGKTLENDEENIASLMSSATDFLEKRIPALKILGIV